MQVCRVQKGLHTIFSHEKMLDGGELLAVATCESKRVFAAITALRTCLQTEYAVHGQGLNVKNMKNF